MPEAVAPRPAVEQMRPRGIRLAERSDLGKIDLRGDPTDRTFMSAVGRCLDMLLPSEPATSAGKGTVVALWLGPDQWLITCPKPDRPALVRSLREALDGTHAAVTDVSDGRVAFRLSSPSAREVLAKGCPLDFHPRMFKAGTAAQSLLAKASVLIHLVEDKAGMGPVFDVYVGRSFSHYLFDWLEDAGREYGVQIDRSA